MRQSASSNTVTITAIIGFATGVWQMKVFEAALLLVVGTVLLTFSSLSFMLAPRALTWSNPALLVEVSFAAGAVFAVLGIRGLYRLHQVLSGRRSASSAQAASV